MNPDYLKDIDFLEAPLIGLNPNLHDFGLRSEISDEQLRAWVQEIRTLRENRMTFKSKVELKGKTSEQSKQKTEQLFGGFVE